MSRAIFKVNMILPGPSALGSAIERLTRSSEFGSQCGHVVHGIRQTVSPGSKHESGFGRGAPSTTTGPVDAQRPSPYPLSFLGFCWSFQKDRSQEYVKEVVLQGCVTGQVSRAGEEQVAPPLPLLPLSRECSGAETSSGR